jgi:hypothetical protein
MIACVDRSNDLVLEVQDFNRAMAWLLEAENQMSLIFQVGSVVPDSRVMDEVVHFIKQHPGAVEEHIVVNFMRGRTSSMTIGPMLKNMEAARMIVAVGVDSRGMKKFTAP